MDRRLVATGMVIRLDDRFFPAGAAASAPETVPPTRAVTTGFLPTRNPLFLADRGGSVLAHRGTEPAHPLDAELRPVVVAGVEPPDRPSASLTITTRRHVVEAAADDLHDPARAVRQRGPGPVARGGPRRRRSQRCAMVFRPGLPQLTLRVGRFCSARPTPILGSASRDRWPRRCWSASSAPLRSFVGVRRLRLLQRARLLGGVRRRAAAHQLSIAIWTASTARRFVVGFLVALDRPEIWLFWGPYGLWLFWKDPGARGARGRPLRDHPDRPGSCPCTWAADRFSCKRQPATGIRAPTVWPSPSIRSPWPSSIRAAWPTDAVANWKVVAALVVVVSVYRDQHQQTYRARVVSAGLRTEPQPGRAPYRRRPHGPGRAGVWLSCVIAFMTQAGFSGNNRYLVLGSALVDICGAHRLSARWRGARARGAGAARRWRGVGSRARVVRVSNT